VAPSGGIHVFDVTNQRVQRFSPAGEFELMLGGEVNKTSGADRCTAADLEGGDVCGAGVTGTGPGEFSIEPVIGIDNDYLALSPAGTLYAGDKDRIQEFDEGGNYLGEIPYADVNAEESAFPASGNPGALAVDPVSEDLYFAFAQGVLEERKIHGLFRLSPAGTFVDRLMTMAQSLGNVDSFEAVAVDGEGAVFAADKPILGGFQQERRVVAFDEDGNLTIPYYEEPEPG
jgi:hypothetical protein